MVVAKPGGRRVVTVTVHLTPAEVAAWDALRSYGYASVDSRADILRRWMTEALDAALANPYVGDERRTRCQAALAALDGEDVPDRSLRGGRPAVVLPSPR